MAIQDRKDNVAELTPAELGRRPTPLKVVLHYIPILVEQRIAQARWNRRESLASRYHDGYRSSLNPSGVMKNPSPFFSQCPLRTF